MSDLSQFVRVVIDRSSKTPTQASFGIPAIIGQFATSKTVTPFTRTRIYTSLASMEADGWSIADSIYNAAAQVFGQANSVEQLIVGRIDATDASLDASLNAIAGENNDWYGFVLVGTYALTVSLSAALATGHVLSSSFNGVKAADVPFTTDTATTMNLWKTAIQAALPGSTATVTGNSIAITLAGQDLKPVVTIAGTSVPTVSYSWTQDKTKHTAAGAWVATRKKVYLWDTNDVDAYDPTKTTDLFSVFKALSYDRTCGIFHKLPYEYAALAWIGEGFPYDPGSSTYAYRTLQGVTPDGLTDTQEQAILAKNGSYYTSTASIQHTYEGKVASGEFLDVIIGIDWIEARMKERVFGSRVNNRKNGYSDAGLEAEGTIIKSVLSDAETAHILIAGTSSVKVPKAASISQTDRANRYAPGFEFQGQVEGAIHKSKISGHIYT